MEVSKVFVEQLKQAICDSTYPCFDFGGRPVLAWNTDGYAKIDELLNNFIKENDIR